MLVRLVAFVCAATLLVAATFAGTRGSEGFELVVTGAPPSADDLGYAVRHKTKLAANWQAVEEAAVRAFLVAEHQRRQERARAARVRREAPVVAYAASEGNPWGLPPLLRRIGGCESSGRPDGPLIWTAQNPRSTASGAFQYLDSTWAGYAGFARAMYAPPHVQIERAVADFHRLGTRPWLASRRCWS